MALSKPINFTEKINKFQWSRTTDRKIHDEEIMLHCLHKQDKAISVELIHHMLGGPNMEYKAMGVTDSFECFDYCADDLINLLKSTKSEILFFEHRNNSTSNILVVVIKQKKSNTTREHPVLLAVIRLTIMMTGVFSVSASANLCLSHPLW